MVKDQVVMSGIVPIYKKGDKTDCSNHMVRHPRCVFINYN